MSAAKRCDRCGAYYPHIGRYGKYVTIVNDRRKRTGECFDLCDECMEKLVNWLKDGWSECPRCKSKVVSDD